MRKIDSMTLRNAARGQVDKGIIEQIIGALIYQGKSAPWDIEDIRRTGTVINFPNTVETILKDFPDDPEYPNGSVWKDADGKFWKVVTGDQHWVTFGSSTLYTSSAPTKPLTRIK